MKKCNIISVLLLLFVIMLSACGQNVSENNVKETINNSNEKVDTTSDENSSLVDTEEEYAYEDGKYLVSETFTSIANYDDCIYKIMQYSSSTQESSIDDIDFLLQQIDKYKDRSERSLSELENYNYADIIE